MPSLDESLFSVPVSEVDLSLNQNQNKDSYTNEYISDVYKKVGLDEIERSILALYNTKGWNPYLRCKCFNNLLQNLTQFIEDCEYSSRLFENESTALTVCSSIKQFLTELESKGNSPNKVRTAVNTIVSACCSNTTKSCRQLSSIIVT